MPKKPGNKLALVAVLVHSACDRQFKGDASKHLAHPSLSAAFAVTDIFRIGVIQSEIPSASGMIFSQQLDLLIVSVFGSFLIHKGKFYNRKYFCLFTVCFIVIQIRQMNTLKKLSWQMSQTWVQHCKNCTKCFCVGVGGSLQCEETISGAHNLSRRPKAKRRWLVIELIRC